MTDCGAVHDWITRLGFRSETDLRAYIDRRRAEGNAMVTKGAFWPCVATYDFETEFIIDRNKHLHRRDRRSKQFRAIGLDPGTYAIIRQFLGGL